MFFASDNAGPAHPSVMQAMVDANSGYMGSYGADPIMERVRAKIREVFEAPEAAVYLVATGTAANALLLATYAQPWHAVFCADVAHVEQDECGAPEFFTNGAKLSLIPTADGRIAPDALRAAIARHPAGVVHGVQPGPLSITQITESGTLYGLDEIAALTAIAKEHGLPVHLDGARFANALVALDCSAADMTWRAGVDCVSFGGTKNGLPGVEAAVIFDPEKAWEFELRRKRAAHLFSKHRYLSAQMEAYLADGLWLKMAAQANANCAKLAEGLRETGVEMLHQPRGNMLFARLPMALHEKLKGAGAVYYAKGGTPANATPDSVVARLVCDWSLPEAELDRFIGLLKG
ncbi:threonine aldolase family protein [Oceaniglobus roseus]|uniref:threonine aldolase family protein n=1 Tax=Oceaniglobus roseus TaxID=1737570 RepID=UPI000C7E8D1E|nr:low specificity L-threonine aldolase [Kandeliimicrobium roseum]